MTGFSVITDVRRVEKGFSFTKTTTVPREEWIREVAPVAVQMTKIGKEFSVVPHEQRPGLNPSNAAARATGTITIDAITFTPVGANVVVTANYGIVFKDANTTLDASNFTIEPYVGGKKDAVVSTMVTQCDMLAAYVIEITESEDFWG